MKSLLSVMLSAAVIFSFAEAHNHAAGHAKKIPTEAEAVNPAGPLHVEGGWARESYTGTSAIYAHIRNTSEHDKLIAASCEGVGRVELHTHIKDGEIYKMRPIEAIDIPAGGTVLLESGGLHIMLLDLKQPLEKGQLLSCKAKFANAGEVPFTVPVKSEKCGCGCKGQKKK
ncbi:MAG: copper chaperone PCu(A)C [Holosporales bacterium]